MRELTLGCCEIGDSNLLDRRPRLQVLSIPSRDDNDVTMDSLVHVLAADEEDGFGEGWN